MPTDPGPYDLDETRAILTADLTAIAKDVTPNFYAELGDFAGQVLISRFAFSEPWPTWEMHPAGDEIVYLLEGDVTMVLRDASGERTLRLRKPGSYIVVPKGAWHTARPHRPTAMLFVTPGEGTENREQPPL